MSKNRIDFWGIGTQKSGTTWLYSNLKKLPLFDLPPVKELHYFDRNPEYPSPSLLIESSLVMRLQNFRWLKKAIKEILIAGIKTNDLKQIRFYWQWNFSNYNDEWYSSLFELFGGVTGEITPSYSILEVADIQRMFQLAPKAKLILMLRNPIDRAWSNFRFNHQHISNFAVEEVPFDAIVNFIESEGQVLRSDYLRTIRNYTQVFPKEQILIGFYDAIIDCPAQLLNDIITFIGHDIENVSEYCDLKRKVNTSKQYSCPEGVRIYLKTKYQAQIKELMETYGGYFVKWYKETYEGVDTWESDSFTPTLCINSY